MIHNCYTQNQPIYHSLEPGYRQEYYRLHQEKLLEYNKKYYLENKTRIKFIKKLWFQKNKERLRIKHGFKGRNETRIMPEIQTKFIKKNITLSFD